MSPILSMAKLLADRVESPASNFMWSTLSACGALLGDKTWLPFGHTTIRPNMYALLLGSSGTCKSSAIKTIQELVLASGCDYMISGKSALEAFINKLQKLDFGAEFTNAYVCEDEFSVFIGTNHNAHFIDVLGTLWDIDKPYIHSGRTGSQVEISTPLLSMFGAMTPATFHRIFPPSIAEQGFLSRVILVNAPRRTKRVPFPDTSRNPVSDEIIAEFAKLRTLEAAPAVLSKDARLTLNAIYNNWDGIKDIRFTYYGQRRFIHLLKLVLISSKIFGDTSGDILREHVIFANTVLSYTEHYMPVALGSLGEAKNTEVANKVLDYIGSKFPEVITQEEVYKVVAYDVTMRELCSILEMLSGSGKITVLENGRLTHRVAYHHDVKLDYVDWDLIAPYLDNDAEPV